MYFLCFSPVSALMLLIFIVNVSATTTATTTTTSVAIQESTQHRPTLSDKLLDQNYASQSDSTNLNEYGEFTLIQSNVLQVKQNKPRSKRTSDFANNSTVTTLPAGSQNSTLLLVETRSREDKKYKHGNKNKNKKKKKNKKGLYDLLKKMKKEIPKFMKKMMPMMKMPSMFMLGMAQANLHNFVMHALMMSKMALSSVIIMIIRELVFGDKDEPVKYYNFGYDAPPRRRIITTIEHPVWKKRRRRHT